MARTRPPKSCQTVFLSFLQKLFRTARSISSRNVDTYPKNCTANTAENADHNGMICSFASLAQQLASWRLLIPMKNSAFGHLLLKSEPTPRLPWRGFYSTRCKLNTSRIRYGGVGLQAH